MQSVFNHVTAPKCEGNCVCVRVCVLGVHFHVLRGKGGQVFALTQFNEGCACVCAHACLPLHVRRFHGERTSRDTGARMEVAALIVHSAQVSSFNICCTREKKKSELVEAFCVQAAAPCERGRVGIKWNI